MRRDGLFDLKQKWLPLLFAGAAIFGAGVALAVLWAYRQSPPWVTDSVVDFLTPASPDPPPRGTLISATAAAFIVVGGGLLWLAVRRIYSSDVGEIRSFWWKVAVGLLVGRWWLGGPRLVVLAAEACAPPVLQAAKKITADISVIAAPTAPLVTALAHPEDMPTITELISGRDADTIVHRANALRLRGRFLPSTATAQTLDAITRADAILFAPDLTQPDGGIAPGAELAIIIRRSGARKILLSPTTAHHPNSLLQTERMLAVQYGEFDAVLANNNTVAALPDGRYYQQTPRALLRDIADWEQPQQWSVEKLGVFLREAIGG